MKPKYLYLVLLALLLAACGPTNQDVIEQYRPQYDALRTDLQAIAQTISEYSAEQLRAPTLDPPPTYVQRDAAASNTEIVMYAQLLDPEVDLRDNDQLDFMLSNELIRSLMWTGENSSMSPETLKKKAGDSFTATLEQALQNNYLGVARVTGYEPPVAVDAETFGGGIAEIEGYLVDMEDQSIVCAFKITATPPAQVSYQVKEGESATEALTRWARSALWENAREGFIASLNEMCAGSFALD